ncbi:MAG: adenylyl-sulfate kinase [Candidatus Nezhaarchaeota archaeon]|nr:adenylyl-sulfate kinase [Candidatus Nezhaarchaeota archaeon]
MGGFAIWLTGIPSSGKSTIAKRLEEELRAHGVDVEVLESDEVRKHLTPRPTYTEEERDAFYSALVFIGELLAKHGISVIFDATANKRAYRDEARRRIKKFVEVYVKCPLDEAMRRDSKGLYKKALRGEITSLPGLQVPYEEPLNPEVVVDTSRTEPEKAVEAIIVKLREGSFL